MVAGKQTVFRLPGSLHHTDINQIGGRSSDGFFSLFSPPRIIVFNSYTASEQVRATGVIADAWRSLDLIHTRSDRSGMYSLNNKQYNQPMVLYSSTIKSWFGSPVRSFQACFYAYTVIQLGIFNSRICIPVMHHAIVHYAPETPGACSWLLHGMRIGQIIIFIIQSEFFNRKF
jgi:hypothetical protein